eukprot:g12239.t1
MNSVYGLDWNFEQSGTFDCPTNQIFANEIIMNTGTLSLRGRGKNNLTIFTAATQKRHFRIGETATLSLRFIKLQNGNLYYDTNLEYIAESTDSYVGGSVRIWAGGSIFIHDCYFLNNKAMYGGAIWLNDINWYKCNSNCGSMNVTGTTFEGNEAWASGGAVSIEGIHSESTTISFENCIFKKNIAGGGISLASGYGGVDLDYTGGGAIFTRNVEKMTLNIKNCSFIENDGGDPHPGYVGGYGGSSGEGGGYGADLFAKSYLSYSINIDDDTTVKTCTSNWCNSINHFVGDQDFGFKWLQPKELSESDTFPTKFSHVSK